jgi:hypothetical protein
MNVELG